MKDDDRRIIQKVQEGDYAAFNQIVLRHKIRVYTVIYRMVHNRADAEDLTQDTFIKAFRAIDRFDIKRPLMPWLYRIAHNVSINFLKKKRPTVSTEDVTLATKNPRYNPVKSTEQKMLLERVQGQMAKLPKDLKAVLVLRVNEEMSYNDIAETLGISRGTVMSRLSRARSKLKELVFGRGHE